MFKIFNVHNYLTTEHKKRKIAQKLDFKPIHRTQKKKNNAEN